MWSYLSRREREDILNFAWVLGWLLAASLFVGLAFHNVWAGLATVALGFFVSSMI